MRKLLFLSILYIFFGLISTSGYSQNFPDMDESPMDLALAKPSKNAPAYARVIYSRPQKKGRQIFGELVPYGKIWRTGANEATELTIYTPLYLGKTILDPGTYTLYSIPNENSWTIIINCDTNVWGAFSYKKEKDAIRIEVPSQKAAASIETLSMIFRPEKNGTTLMIGWDDRFVEIPFKKEAN